MYNRTNVFIQYIAKLYYISFTNLKWEGAISKLTQIHSGQLELMK